MKRWMLLFVCLAFSGVQGQVKINEVLYSTSEDQVELKNFGDVSVDVSGWWFCSKFNYTSISSMTIISGSLTIPAGGILAVEGITLDNDDADLGLYNTNNFGSASAMEDFVQWGDGGNGREGVATTKGIWTAGDFVPTVESGHSIEYDGEGNASSDWFDQPEPTIGSENDVATSVAGAEIPTHFRLEQNHPNPFNPSTVIEYAIAEQAGPVRATLEIYNLLGQRVRTLVDGEQAAGTYSARWDGTDDGGTTVASGVYLYRLTAGDFVAMRKMLFLR